MLSSMTALVVSLICPPYHDLDSTHVSPAHDCDWRTGTRPQEEVRHG